MKVFKHGGATGDIIYSLPVVKALGGGKLNITMEHQQRAESIKKLIEVQPYISEVEIGQPQSLDYDLDRFRNVFRGSYDNIIDSHFRGQGIENNVSDWINGWLTLPELEIDFKYLDYCVVNRTERYNDDNCKWGEELDYLRSITPNILFIGYKDEYDRFIRMYGNVDYIDVDFLQGAYLLQYAKMFTGNYSAWASIAQGLGISYRLEQAPNHTCSSLFIPRETIINI